MYDLLTQRATPFIAQITNTARTYFHYQSPLILVQVLRLLMFPPDSQRFGQVVQSMGRTQLMRWFVSTLGAVG